MGGAWTKWTGDNTTLAARPYPGTRMPRNCDIWILRNRRLAAARRRPPAASQPLRYAVDWWSRREGKEKIGGRKIASLTRPAKAGLVGRSQHRKEKKNQWRLVRYFA